MNDNQNEPGPVPANGGTSGALRQTAQNHTARRNLLRRGGVVAAATVAGLTLLDQRRAEALDGQSIIIGQANDGNLTTELHPTTTNGTVTLNPLFHINGANLSGTSTSMIVDGPGSIAGIALRVNGFGGGTGIITSAQDGPQGTVGLALAASGGNGADAIHASSDKGTGVAASSTSGKGVAGSSASNTGVAGSSTSGPGVTGNSRTNAGVAGVSVNNVGVTGKGRRGGVFNGQFAGIQIVGQPTLHPASGAKGDLFVDKNAHLWFCHGGASWTKLA